MIMRVAWFVCPAASRDGGHGHYARGNTATQGDRPAQIVPPRARRRRCRLCGSHAPGTTGTCREVAGLTQRVNGGR
jgi:hypothetical protein